jgi:hypothetical protein
MQTDTRELVQQLVDRITRDAAMGLLTRDVLLLTNRLQLALARDARATCRERANG